MQRIWNLNFLVSTKKDQKTDKEREKKFVSTINSFVNKIDDSIVEFKFNVTIAYFYELYKIFRDNVEENISKKILSDSIVKIMKLMIPFTPHLAYECLELHNCKSLNKWPEREKNTLEEIKIAVQINGKTRDIINVNKNLDENEIFKIILNSSKASKYIHEKNIKKTIFVKNKIINYIIPN